MLSHGTFFLHENIKPIEMYFLFSPKNEYKLQTLQGFFHFVSSREFFLVFLRGFRLVEVKFYGHV